jgi:hypothetical protein
MIDKSKSSLEQVQGELRDLWDEYVAIVGRFKYMTLPFMKSRVPVNWRFKYPEDNNILRLVTAFIEELFDKAPRTCAYLVETALIIWVIRVLG